MEMGEKTSGDVESSSQEIISLLEEEEIVLYWKESNTWKYVRELASEDSDDNKEVIDYYRSVVNFIIDWRFLCQFLSVFHIIFTLFGSQSCRIYPFALNS